MPASGLPVHFLAGIAAELNACDLRPYLLVDLSAGGGDRTRTPLSGPRILRAAGGSKTGRKHHDFGLLYFHMLVAVGQELLSGDQRRAQWWAHAFRPADLPVNHLAVRPRITPVHPQRNS